jgi:hypothetical protein
VSIEAHDGVAACLADSNVDRKGCDFLGIVQQADATVPRREVLDNFPGTISAHAIDDEYFHPFERKPIAQDRLKATADKPRFVSARNDY